MKHNDRLLTMSLFWFTVAVVLAVYLFGTLHTAQAQAPVERRLALALARTSYNEAGAHEADLDLIWQAVQANGGDTAASQLAWLQNHSPCVNGLLTSAQAYERPGRCRWTRNLTPDGRTPRGWPGTMMWSRHRRAWLEHYEAAVARVRGVEGDLVCPLPPRSWDGSRWRDDVLERGWTVLDCKGTRNLGVVR